MAEASSRTRDLYLRYRQDRECQAAWSMANPGNRAAARERNRKLGSLLAEAGLLPLASKRILEIGCGNANVLADLIGIGADPHRVVGADLMVEQLCEARSFGRFFPLLVGNAGQLGLAPGSVDVVVCFTVFSSTADDREGMRLAEEVTRVLCPSGAVIWYDIRVGNPRNRLVRGIGRRGIKKLFPAFSGRCVSLTVLPPLARRLGRTTDSLYPLLARIPMLRTHNLAVLQRHKGGDQ